jgi:hypothetical protein
MDWKFGLNFYGNIYCIFNPNDLLSTEVSNVIEKDKYHIYLLCKRKKIHFENFIERDNIGYTTLFYLNEKLEKKYLEYKNPISILRINEVRNGLYNIDTSEQTGVWLRDFLMINKFCLPVDNWLNHSFEEPLPSDLEIVYIGQAFGRTKSKNIDYRISNHEKIQKIALDILDTGSNEEVLIIGVNVKINDSATSIIPNDLNLENAYRSGQFRELRNNATNRISDAQAITIFEASLIKYFQPKLNTIHKNTFPSPTFKSYNEIYQVDFLYSAITLDTRPIEVRIFSQYKNERSFIHLEAFSLTDVHEKENLFGFL